jgi:hypothetical protein
MENFMSIKKLAGELDMNALLLNGNWGKANLDPTCLNG